MRSTTILLLALLSFIAQANENLSFWEQKKQFFERYKRDITSPSRIQVREYIQEKRYKAIADIGCGPFIDYFGFQKSDLPYTIDYCGVDTDPAIIAYGEKNDINCFLGTIESLPFASSQFEVAYTRHSLEFLPSYHQGLTELIRVADKEVIVVFCIKLHGLPIDTDIIHYTSNGYYNSYHKKNLEQFVLSCTKVKGFSWETIKQPGYDNEAILHIYLEGYDTDEQINDEHTIVAENSEDESIDDAGTEQIEEDDEQNADADTEQTEVDDEQNTDASTEQTTQDDEQNAVEENNDETDNDELIDDTGAFIVAEESIALDADAQPIDDTGTEQTEVDDEQSTDASTEQSTQDDEQNAAEENNDETDNDELIDDAGAFIVAEEFIALDADAQLIDDAGTEQTEVDDEQSTDAGTEQTTQDDEQSTDTGPEQTEMDDENLIEENNAATIQETELTDNLLENEATTQETPTQEETEQKEAINDNETIAIPQAPTILIASIKDDAVEKALSLISQALQKENE